MKKYINHYGLLNANSASEGNFCENSFLTTARYFQRWGSKELKFKATLVMWEHCWHITKGFQNLPDKEMETAGENDRNISPDQLLAYAVTSEGALDIIYEDMKFMFYKGRFMGPKVWAFIGYYKKRSWFYKWVLKIACTESITTFGETGATSGVLKVWTIYKALGWKLPDLNWDNIFETYYEDDHPLNTGVMIGAVNEG